MRTMGIFGLSKSRKPRVDHRSEASPVKGRVERAGDGDLTFLAEDEFRRALSLERKRSERSSQRSVLMLVHAGESLGAELDGPVVERIKKAISRATRETDPRGWYEQGKVVGVICTEIGPSDMTTVTNALRSRVSAALRHSLGHAQMHDIRISFQRYLGNQSSDRPSWAYQRVFQEVKL